MRVRGLLLSLLALSVLLVMPAHAQQVHVGNFATGTGAAGTTVTVPMPFAAKAIVFFTNPRENTAAAGQPCDTGDLLGASHAKLHMGFYATDTNTQHSGGFMALDSQATTNGGSTQGNGEALRFAFWYNGYDGWARVTSVTGSNFVLTIDNSFEANNCVGFFAFGSQVTNAVVGDFQTETSTGTKDITVTSHGGATPIGFQPDLVFILGLSKGSAIDTVGAPANLSIGAAVRNTADLTVQGQAVTWFHSQSGLVDPNPPNTTSYGTSGEAFIAASTTPTIIARGSVSAFLTNGFQINRITSSATRSFFFLAIKGGNYKLGEFTTQTDTTTDIVCGTGAANCTPTSLGFQPSGVLVFSHNKAESTPGTTQANAELSIGAGSSPTNEFAFFAQDEDKASDAATETAHGSRVSDVLGSITLSDTLDSAMHWFATGSDSITFRMSDQDSANNWGWFIVTGDTAAGGGTGCKGRFLGFSSCAR